jgi:hypothetical protein
MKSFMRRARLVLYSVPFVLIPAAFYALGFFGDISLTAWDWLAALLVPLAIAEIISVVYWKSTSKFFTLPPLTN